MKHKARRTILSVMIIGIGITSFTVKVSAQTAAHHESITATVFFEPSDKPEVNVDTTVRVSFADQSNVFRIENCSCTVTFDHTNAETEKIEIELEGVGTSTTFLHRFLETGEYAVNVRGTPRGLSTFQPFNLELPATQVSQPTANSALLNFTSRVIVTGTILIAIIIFFVIPARTQNRRPKSKSNAPRNVKATSRKF